MIYLDNAATSGYKPEAVIRSVSNALRALSANPGRSGHNLSVSAAEAVYKVRERLSDFFGATGPERVIFTGNCTQAVNFVLKGVLNANDGLIISNLEHNAVARPAFSLREKGVKVSVFDGFAKDPTQELNNLITKDTKLIFCTHVSNVCGKIIDIAKIGALCKKHGILFGVDAAQSGGVLPINMKEMGIDFLCLAPHKGLFAPMGTGVLIAEKQISKTVIEGGTGTASLSLAQPEDLPERLESGTINLPGICGIGAGVDFLLQKGRENILRHEAALCQKLYDDLKGNSGITVFGNGNFINEYAPLLSVSISGVKSDEVAALLDRKGIAVRGGYHCAPLAHKAMGTVNGGTVRIAPGINNCVWDIEQVKRALFSISNKKY
ncbi:MAG: aminotransferase class V-fold PLP-dependent enzyme [Clostridia bacterium]|nr:aminotransferase class V-fold PLP-dependent enzyme [Clostridia bacterium]